MTKDRITVVLYINLETYFSDLLEGTPAYLFQCYFVELHLSIMHHKVSFMDYT